MSVPHGPATPSVVTLIATGRAVHDLDPLVQVWRNRGGCRVIDPAAARDRAGSEAPVDPALWHEVLATSRAVLLVGPRARSPRTVLPGPVAAAPDGRLVPVAWLPRLTEGGAAGDGLGLSTFARAAARVHARGGEHRDTTDDDDHDNHAGRGRERASLAVLGERQPRFDRLAGRIMAAATAPMAILAGRDGRTVSVHRWTAYEVSREEVTARLAHGPALAAYIGHGRPAGWVGYAGTRRHHLTETGLHHGGAAGAPREPAGALLSLTCLTASRRHTGLSFAEAIPLSGVAAASLGAVCPTRHTANARWAVRLGDLLARCADIGQLVAAMAAADPTHDVYRLLGDPTAPLLDSAAMRTVDPLTTSFTTTTQEAS